MKIPIASLDVWLCSSLAAQANMLMVELLRHFVLFYLNTLYIYRHIAKNVYILIMIFQCLGGGGDTKSSIFVFVFINLFFIIITL